MATNSSQAKRSDLDANEMLLERLDKMTTILAASAQGHYRRTYTAVDIANPGPLAFLSFSVATGMQGLFYTGKLELMGAEMIISVGLFVGGLLMLITGFAEFLRRNTMGATMFTVYGAFWFSLMFYNYNLVGGSFHFALTTLPKTLTALACFVGIITSASAFINAFVSPVLSAATTLLAIFLFMLAGSQNTSNVNVTKGTGWMGVVTSIAAFYVAMGMLFEETLGREILPMFYSKQYKLHAGNLYPRISLSDPRSISAGVPYEGRFEISKGDNVAAMQQPSLVDLNRIHTEQRV